jgi:deazaflavin-dependent oxidoreductase (nitroreductase family)
MSSHYEAPSKAVQLANMAVRWLADMGISVAGTQALRVRGRKSGKVRGVVINLLTVDGVDYVVSPRGNTQWARNVRAAGAVHIGPVWNRRQVGAAEVPDAVKPELLRRYLDRWHYQVKDYVGGLTPDSTDEQLLAGAPAIPVFELTASR